MRYFLMILLLGMLMASNSAAATCDVSINLGFNRQIMAVSAKDVYWKGCGGGKGVQAALSALGLSGGGNLTFTGNNVLLVEEPLYVFAGTTVRGDANDSFQVTIAGANQTFSNGCTSGGNSRSVDCPIFVVQDQFVENKVTTFYNIKFIGRGFGTKLLAPAIQIQGSSNVAVAYVQIQDAHKRGISVFGSAAHPRPSLISISYLTMNMIIGESPIESGGGYGVYLRSCDDCEVRNSYIDAYPYFATGVPPCTNGNMPNCAPAMDLIASYAGNRTSIHQNHLYWTNTAGIYLSWYAPQAGRELSSLVWGNVIEGTRENGIDVANLTGGSILSNTVSNCGFSCLSLSDTYNTSVMYNILSNSGGIGSFLSGTLTLTCASSANTVSDNEIRGPAAAHAVFFDALQHVTYGDFCSSNQEAASGNTVINNVLWKGSVGHLGGEVGLNSATPNACYVGGQISNCL